MYILDSILKNVQGNYVHIFQGSISQIFQLAFTQATSDLEQKSLIKLFNVWRLLLDRDILDKISVALNLQEHVSLSCDTSLIKYGTYFYQSRLNLLSLQEQHLLKERDKQKISDFMKKFIPSSLPEDIQASGLFTTGTEVSLPTRVTSQFDYQNQQQRLLGQHQYSRSLNNLQGMGAGGFGQ